MTNIFGSRAALLVLLPLIILIADAVALFNLHQPPRYPFLVVQSGNGSGADGNAPGGVKFSVLLQSTRTPAACDAAKDSYANALMLRCPSCQIAEAACLTRLTNDQVALLSPNPLQNYSATIPNGAVSFISDNVDTAAAACHESAKESTLANVICVPPSTARPQMAGGMPDDERALRPSSLVWLAISIVLLAAWPYFFRHARGDTLVGGLVSLSRREKQALIGTVDLVLVELSLWLAFVLRLDTFYIPPPSQQWLFIAAPLVAAGVFVQFGLYQSIIRYLGLQGMIQIAKAVATYLALMGLVIYLVGTAGIPRSIIPIHGTLVLLFIGTMRGLARVWLSQSEHSMFGPGLPRKHVAIYGAGSAGIQLAHALAHSRELKPMAFIDDDPKLHRNRLGELEVFGPDRLLDIINQFGITEVLLAIPSANRQRRGEIIDWLESFAVQVRTLPMVSDLVEGKIKIDDLREVEIDDLLGRDAVAPNSHLLRARITGKSVMVTGAGGSIGSELCRQILALQPRSLVLFENSEFALYSIEQELRELALRTSRTAGIVHPVMGSVTDQARLERTIAAFGVNTIYHAAAYKHVPMVESNPCEGVVNNILGTHRAALAAMRQGVETFVLVSTDKAVRPTNTMGATKRFAEMVLQAHAAGEPRTRHNTNLSMVRFGNVLGSSGSVVPLFKAQIRHGGPVTVTDPRIIRYFMTISEAAQLVLQAGAMGQDGDVFVLDMGEPVKILDLAQRMIRLSGLQPKTPEHPEGDIEIAFTGLRPGEKLYEELLTGNNPEKTAHPRIMRASEKVMPLSELDALLTRMEKAAAAGDSDAIRGILLEAVEEFQPQCGNEDVLKDALEAQA